MSMFQQLTIPAETVENWLPLIEGKGDLKDFVLDCPKVDHADYGLMAQIMENTHKMLTERTDSGDIARLPKIIMPIIRRVIPAVIGPRILATQPFIGGPDGAIFYLKKVYHNTGLVPVKEDTAVILVLADATAFTEGTDISTDGAGAGIGVIAHKSGNKVLVKVTSGTFAETDDVDDAAVFSAGVTTVSAVLPNEVRLDTVFPNYAGPHLTAAGESLGNDMKQLGATIGKITMTADTHKLKTQWTEEMSEDLRAAHNIDALALLSKIASDDLILEQNQRIIDLIHSATTVTTAYDYTSADGLDEKGKVRALTSQIARAKRSLSSQSQFGNASWIMVSGAMAGYLESYGYIDDRSADPLKEAYAGKLLGMDCFVDINAANDDVYLGVKKNDMAASHFYSPYVPLRIGRTTTDVDGQNVSFFTSRYQITANPFGASNFLKKITVANLPA